MSWAALDIKLQVDIAGQQWAGMVWVRVEGREERVGVCACGCYMCCMCACTVCVRVCVGCAGLKSHTKAAYCLLAVLLAVWHVRPRPIHMVGKKKKCPIMQGIPKHKG